LPSALCPLPCQTALPQNDGIFSRILVVIATDALDRESQFLIEAPRGRIRSANLEGRGARPPCGGLGQHVQQQPAGQAVTPACDVDGQAVDVQFVEDHPAGAIGDEGAGRIVHQIEPRDVGVLELPPDGLRSPRIRERLTLERVHRGEIVGTARPPDGVVGRRRLLRGDPFSHEHHVWSANV
jgi:hypothetical protein